MHSGAAAVGFTLFSLLLAATTATAQRPGPGAVDGNCAGPAAEGDTLQISCSSGGVITAVDFAMYGAVQGSCPMGLTKGSCGTDVSAHMRTACVGQSSCTMHCSHKDQGCENGVGPTCGCAFTSGPNKSKAPFLAVADPCPGKSKQQGARVTCNTSQPAAGGGVPSWVRRFVRKS